MRARTSSATQGDLTACLPATITRVGAWSSGPDRKLYFTIGDLGANQLANFCNPNRAQSVPTAAQAAGA
jgi:hypothetical protein